MILLAIVLSVCVLGIGLRLLCTLIRTSTWLISNLPMALFMWLLGLLCCCTLILIPVGIRLFRSGLKMLIP